MESYQKHVNGLTDSNKMKRCASYKQLSGLVKQDPTLFPKKEAFDLIRTCLKGFEDPSERCREEAISIVNELVSSQDANVLDWVLPSVVTRIGITPVAENSEELRLHLLKLASKCMSAFPHEIGPRNFMDFFQVLLENCLSDPYPDLKKEACRIVVQLCQIEPQQVKAIATPIAQAIKKSCLLHKHSSVRSEAVDAFGVLIRHGATSVLSEKSEAANNATEAQLYILANDHSEPVRIAVLNVLSHILLGINERLEYHKKYFPQSLSFPPIR
ncbi:HEAT repeat-containing protein 2, partial [Angomonas deanei]